MDELENEFYRILESHNHVIVMDFVFLVNLAHELAVAAQQKMHPTLLESVPILDKDGELVGTRSVDIENPQSG